ncbi:MAG TPA: DUF4012 domain-containing protein [Candidatus Woesebacteria bacterium]|nr:DUF4012 domain-containing protein [Candidatus Woesebacteria bacterium]
MNKINIKKKSRQVVKMVIGMYLLGLILSFLVALILTTASVYCLSRHQLKQAQFWVVGSDQSLKVAGFLVGSDHPTIEMWRQGLRIIQSIPKLQTIATNVVLPEQSSVQKSFTPDGLITLEQLQQSVEIIYQWINASSFRQKIVGSKLSWLTQLRNNLPMVITLYRLGLNNSANILILMQNSDELRASGGFIGSVAWIKIDNQVIDEPQFYDIYDLANRAPYLQPAPLGVAHYLSSGRGLTLADANWEAEFSQNGQTIQRFFEKLEVPTPDIVVALNQSLIEQLLAAIGPIELLDTKQTVYADNFVKLARQSRSDFFAGDKQKKMFFKEFFIGLKLKMASLPTQQWLKLWQTLSIQAQQKQILIYSSIPSIQELATTYRLDGNLNIQSDYYLYLLESNVGINKANQAVSRQIELEFSSSLLKIQVDIFNDNQPLNQSEKEIIENNQDLHQASHLGYVNYLRLITNLPISQAQLLCNGQVVEMEEESTLNTTQGKATQFGFLITLPEQTSTNCIIQLQPQQSLSPDQSWTIVRQPGLPPTTYRFNYFGQVSETVLTQDWLLTKQSDQL